jgi:pyruvate/2-oxoglutarate/acetoin dehydrogenase E1 component
MLWTALQDPDPVLMFENVTLYNMEAEVAAEVGLVDIDLGTGARSGRDVAHHLQRQSFSRPWRQQRRLPDGIDVEVVDPPHCGHWTMRPSELGTKTHRGHCRRRLAQGSISARSAHVSWKTPSTSRMARWSGFAAEVPLPYAKHLEQAALPQAETIIATIKRMVRTHG